jgi:hypothetical protein
MQNFVPIDEETGIEEYPGYVGMTWDGELSMHADFKRFQQFDWDSFSELVQERDEKIELLYKFRERLYRLEFEAYQDLGYMIDELQTVEAHYDDGAKYGGMASGSGFIFFLKNKNSISDAKSEINALLDSLEEKLAELKFDQ